MSQWIVMQYISSALDIYADESTMKSEYGDVLDIKTDNEQ